MFGADSVRLTQRQSGFSMAELLVAVAIMAVLASMVLGLGKRIKTQADEHLCRSTLNILANAMQQYFSDCEEFPFTTYPDPYPAGGDGVFDEDDLKWHLNRASDSSGYLSSNVIDSDVITCEVLYFYLNRLPASRRFIETITDSLVKSDSDNPEYVQRMYAWTDSGGNKRSIELLHFTDPWGNSLRYLYDVGDVFPVIESMGKDGKWDTADDIILSK